MNEVHAEGDRVKKQVPKRERRAITEAVQEMQQLDRDARKPGYSKEKAAKRKRELQEYLRRQGI